MACRRAVASRCSPEPSQAASLAHRREPSEDQLKGQYHSRLKSNQTSDGHYCTWYSDSPRSWAPRSRAAAARPPRTRRDFRCVDTAASVAEMPLTVQSIRRVLKAVRCFFLSLVLAAFAYFVYTMLALGGGGTLDVLGEVPVFLSER